jgi:hypothetical protein
MCRHGTPGLAFVPLTLRLRYAFANLDDVRIFVHIYSSLKHLPFHKISWGTKEEGPTSADLGAVIQDKESRVDLEVIVEPSDVNDAYLEVLYNLRVRKPVTKPPPGARAVEQKAKDYYASIRTCCRIPSLISIENSPPTGTNVRCRISHKTNILSFRRFYLPGY